MKKSNIFALFLAVTVTLGACVTGAYAAAKVPGNASTDCKVTKALGTLLTPILENSANQRTDLNQALFSRMLEEFDHSGNSFIVGEKIDQNKNFTPAITVRLRNGMATIVSVEPDSDGWRKNIRNGDVILKVGDVTCAGATLAEVNTLLKGEKDSSVKVKVLRKSTDKVYRVTLKREDMPVQLFVKTYVDKILYIKPTEITPDTAKNLESKLPEKSDELIGAILDLRGTSGGTPSDATRLAGFFVNKGIVVKAVKNADNAPHVYKVSPGKNLNARLVILVDEGTGLAGEVIAATLQERHRAVVMGHSTCGLGATYHEISNEIYGTVRLPDALLITPEGKAIFNKGILPDIPASYGKVPTREWGNFRHEILALLKEVKPEDLEWPGKKKNEEKDDNSEIIDQLTKDEDSDTDKSEGKEDEDDAEDDDENKGESSVEEQILASYPMVRKYDRPFVRALNLLVSMNIFFSETGSGK